MTEIGEILNEKQLEALKQAGLDNRIAVRAATDEQLVKVNGIGAATVIKLREWSVYDVEEGHAIAKRYLCLKNGKERLDVRPGDSIPPEFGAAEMVDKGMAEWR